MGSEYDAWKLLALENEKTPHQKTSPELKRDYVQKMLLSSPLRSPTRSLYGYSPAKPAKNFSLSPNISLQKAKNHEEQSVSSQVENLPFQTPFRVKERGANDVGIISNIKKTRQSKKNLDPNLMEVYN
jgi:hypothetical protein